MLQSYFFIPANKPKFIAKFDSIDAEFIIFDLEDTVLESEQLESIERIKSFSSNPKVWIRPALFSGDQLDLTLLLRLIQSGFNKILLPKLRSLQDVQAIAKLDSHIKWILLVEHPGLLIQLQEILMQYTDRIVGIGFGSQDYAMYTGLKNKDSIINHVRFQLNAICTAFQKPFIDTASMHIENQELFEAECVNAFEFGCNAKFVLHPKQLETLKKTTYFDEIELSWGKQVLEQLDDEAFRNLTAITINGILLEKPHLKRLKLIKQYLEQR